MRTPTMKTEYKRHNRKKAVMLAVFATLTVLLVFVSLAVGSGNLPLDVVLSALFGKGDRTDLIIIWNIRMPRVLSAVVAGGGLALAGCIMQNVLKNPMASPSTLGVGNAAVFGANIAIIVLGAGSVGTTHGTIVNLNDPYLVSAFAFFFSLLSVGLILILSRYKHFSAGTVVLCGVAVSSVFQAGTMLVQYFANDTQIASAVYWSFGDLSRANYTELLIMTVVVAVAFVYFTFERWNYGAMANGRNFARTLGVKAERITIVSLLFASLITAVCVSFLGIIGFVGLIAPQIVKRFIGDDYRYLLPTSFFAGSAVLLFSDTVARVLVTGVALPVGAITSLIGGPVFLAILMMEKTHHETVDR